MCIRDRSLAYPTRGGNTCSTSSSSGCSPSCWSSPSRRSGAPGTTGPTMTEPPDTTGPADGAAVTPAPGAAPAPGPAAAPDPLELLRSRSYVQLLVLAALIGVPISAVAYFYLALVSKLQHWVFTSLPSDLGFHGTPVWWPVLPPVGGRHPGQPDHHLSLI